MPRTGTRAADPHRWGVEVQCDGTGRRYSFATPDTVQPPRAVMHVGNAPRRQVGRCRLLELGTGRVGAEHTGQPRAARGHCSQKEKAWIAVC